MLSQTSLGVIHSYSTSFDVEEAGTSFELAFTRADMDGAPSSVVVLPEPFEITAPEPGFTFSRSEEGAELSVLWDNESSEDMVVSLSGDCISFYEETETSDSGSHVIPASWFAENDFESDSTSCPVTLTVNRILEGTVDPEFNGGNSTAMQRRSVIFDLIP